MRPGRREKKYIYERDQRTCRFCGKKLFFRQASLDHYWPRSRGGPDSVLNLVLSCKDCNRKKKTGIPKNAEKVLLFQFVQAVEDGMIRIDVPGQKNERVLAAVKTMERLEQLTPGPIFQGPGYRLILFEDLICGMKFLYGMDPKMNQ